jgi:hypothetical protein
MKALLLAVALLQAAAPQGTIRGSVLAAGDEPVPGARVELAGSPAGALVVRTDSRGQFLFSNLKAGSYRLSVKKEGYVRQEYGEKRSGGAGVFIAVGVGAPAPPITFHLQPAATIAGEVRNEDGFPIANILVQALRRSYGARGNRTITPFSSTLTDDQGAYRLYWVDSGDYYVNASYLPQLPTAVNANEDVPRAAYAPTYFPGSNDPAAAELVHLESGTSRDVNFRLQRSPAVTVRGTIYSALADQATRASVVLRAPEESGTTSRYATQTDSRGVFEMKGVNAGTYILSATALSGDGQIGFSRINVLDIDHVRADVVIGPGITLNVRLFGDAPPSADLRTIRVSLVPLETYTPMPEPSIIQPTGVITLSGVQPGDYLLAVSGLSGNAYVKAARSGPRDVLEQFVSMQYDISPTLDIQLAFDGGQITGTAMTAAGQAFDAATIVLAPDPTRRHRPDQYRIVTSARDGRFSIEGIPPGDYKLFAWDSVEPNAWANSDFMRDFEEFGVPISVGPNAKMPAQIRVIPQVR